MAGRAPGTALGGPQPCANRAPHGGGRVLAASSPRATVGRDAAWADDLDGRRDHGRVVHHDVDARGGDDDDVGDQDAPRRHPDIDRHQHLEALRDRRGQGGPEPRRHPLMAARREGAHQEPRRAARSAGWPRAGRGTPARSTDPRGRAGRPTWGDAIGGAPPGARLAKNARQMRSPSRGAQTAPRIVVGSSEYAATRTILRLARHPPGSPLPARTPHLSGALIHAPTVAARADRSMGPARVVHRATARRRRAAPSINK